jgi:hypothetical protein
VQPHGQFLHTGREEVTERTPGLQSREPRPVGLLHQIVYLALGLGESLVPTVVPPHRHDPEICDPVRVGWFGHGRSRRREEGAGPTRARPFRVTSTRSTRHGDKKDHSEGTE